MVKNAKPAKTLTLRISLEDSDPEIWRRFQVAATSTLADFHETIQVVMGWTNSHMHDFTIAQKTYGRVVPDILEMDGQEDIDESQVLVGDVLKRKRQKFVYTYDFGDDWRHNLVVEEIGEQAPEQNYPVCLDGERACPPDDCGGVWGYYEMLKAIRDPNHEEHETYLEWLGGSFDPNRFSLKDRNEILAHLDEYVSLWTDDEEDSTDA